MKETLNITVLNESTNSEEILEIFHDSKLYNREGYQENFLGVKVPLPTPTAPIINAVAHNKTEGCRNSNYLDYTHFSVMFNKNMQLPFFTAVNIEGKSNELALPHESREGDKWFQDDRIIENGNAFQFKDSDYLHSNFQKGHMVRYYDPAWGETKEIKKLAMGDTFYYTNCCPQIRGFNTGSWLNLEDYSMARAIFEDGKVTVFAGPIFKKVERKKELNVPVNFWKILVYPKNDKIEAIGFLLSQEIALKNMFTELSILEKVAILEGKIVEPKLKQEDIDRLFNKKDLKRYLVKISLIEEKTGLKFGLNDFDKNKNESGTFWEKTEGEFEKLTEKERFQHLSLLEGGRFEHGDKDPFDDLEFINNM